LTADIIAINAAGGLLAAISLAASAIASFKRRTASSSVIFSILFSF
jgi:hypothetical protein